MVIFWIIILWLLWCLPRAMHRTDMACAPINLFTYWKVVLVKLCKQGEPHSLLKASWKMLFFNTFNCWKMVFCNTFLGWTQDWRTRDRKRRRTAQRKERRNGTRWSTGSKFLRPLQPQLPQDRLQACGTWTCLRTSSTGRALSRSIKLLSRTARTEIVS